MKSQFEKEIKDKLYDYSAEPRADLFDTIISKTNKKRGFAMWWYTGAAILLLGSGALLINYYLKSKTSQTNQDEVVNSEGERSQNGASHDLISEDETTPSEDEVNVNEMEGESAQKVRNQTHRNLAEESDARNTQNWTPLVDAPRGEESPYKYVESNPTPPIQKDDQTKETQEEMKKLFDKISAEENSETKGEGRLFVRGREVESDKIIAPDWKDKPTKTDDAEPASKDPVKTVAVAQDTLDTADKVKDLVEDLPKPKWMINVYGGPGYASRRLSGTSPEIAARNNAENPSTSYNLGVTLGYQLNNKWNISTGLHQTTRNESFNHTRNWETTTQYDTLVDHVTFHPVHGKIVTQVDSSWTETSQHSQTSSMANSYTQILVPVRIERTFSLGENNNWFCMTNVGVMFGVYQNARGLTLDENLIPVDIQSLNFKKAGINQITTGLGLGYGINEKMLIYLYPQGNVSLNSNSTNAILTQREFGLFSTIGVRIRF